MQKTAVTATVLLCLVLCGPLAAAWEPDFRLTNSQPGLGPYSFANRWLAASAGVVHVAWCDGRGENGDVFYKRSTDAGATWQADFDVVADSEYSQTCAIAAHGQNVHLVWDGDRSGFEDIYARSSHDAGAGWGGTAQLMNDPAISRTPSIACWENYAYIVWPDNVDPGEEGIYFSMSTDAGATWTAAARFADRWIQIGSVIAVEDSMVHAVWMDFRDMTYRVYYKRSFDHGATWTTDEALSSGSGLFASASVTGMNVHVVWTNIENELVYVHSTDGGASWGTEQQLSVADEFPSTFASVASSGPLVHVVWQENRYGGESEVAYRLSRDGGATWQDEVRLTEAGGQSDFPQVAADGNAVHVTWWDTREGEPELYYKRNPDGNVPGVAEGRVGRPQPAIALAPNPFAGCAQVPGRAAERFVVFDAAGRPVQQCSGSRVGAGLAAGVYVLRGARSGMARFVKLP